MTYELTGLQKTYLEHHRDKYVDPVLDGAAEPVAQLDADGMVHFAVESWSQQFAYALVRDLFLNGPLPGWSHQDVLDHLGDVA